MNIYTVYNIVQAIVVFVLYVYNQIDQSSRSRRFKHRTLPQRNPLKASDRSSNLVGEWVFVCVSVCA